MTDNIECVTDPDGSRRWYRNGLLHRDDGPAAEYADGFCRWFRYGVFIKEEQRKRGVR